MSIKTTIIQKTKIIGDSLAEVLEEVSKADNPKKLSIVSVLDGKYSASFETEVKPEPTPEPEPEPTPEPEPQEPE